MTRKSMDEILSQSSIKERLPDAAPAAEERPESEPETTAASETPVAKAEAKTEQPKAAPKPPADEHDEEDGEVPDNLDGLKRALAAARGDKRKARKQWQETEKAMAELRGRLSAMQQQSAPKPAEPQAKPEDEFYANPVAWQQKQLAQVRREMSVEMMRSTREDYDQVVGEFVRDIQGTPLAQQLEQQIANHPNPARFVYDYAKNFSKLKGVNSLDDYEKRIEAQVRAKLEEEYAARTAQTQPAATVTQKPLPKPTLASARGNGAAAPQQWAGPTPFSELFGS